MEDELKILKSTLKHLVVPSDAAIIARDAAPSVGLASAIKGKVRQSLLEKEVELCVSNMRTLGEDFTWADVGQVALPVLAAVAARVLPVPATLSFWKSRDYLSR